MERADKPRRRSADGERIAGQRTQSELKLEKLLASAAALMAVRGFGQTSIRNVAQETGFSLAGMYYYFKNKEDLLYQIQYRTFSSLLEKQEQAMQEDGDAETKLRQLILNHLSYFAHHFNELKVCTFELHSLQGERFRQIEQLRRRYFRYQAEVIAEIVGPAGRGPETDSVVRHATLFVFGMLNWIFMWYDAERDASIEDLGDEMMTLVIDGLRSMRPTRSRKQKER